MFNVIIIGGMAAGCKAAARLNRLSLDFKITIIEKSSFLSISSCGLPFFASGDVSEFTELNKTSYGVVRDKKFFKDVKGTEVLLNTEVREIHKEKNTVECFNSENNEKLELPYDYLILATGAVSIHPPFPIPESPFISSFHSPVDFKNFRLAAQKGEIGKAAIIGGGFIGCEMIEALSSLWGIETFLIEKENSILPAILDAEISGYVEGCIASDKVKLLLSSEVKKIELNDAGSPVIFFRDDQKIDFDYVFYCLGVKPNSGLAQKAGIKTGRLGGIQVDEQMKTNIPNVWAAGDCVETKNLISDQPDYFPLGSLSNRMGRVAADSIANAAGVEKATSFIGAAGTVSLKLFDNIICSTGLTETKAQKLGYSTGSVTGSWYDRPDYYPEVKDILGKLVYEKKSQNLLGLQLVGEGEVTRYIDVFSYMLSQNKKIEDLINLEHGYTPAHSSPISPLNYLGFMALNQENDNLKNCNPIEINSFEGLFIDVRELNEIDNSKFPEKSINIPLAELRQKIKDYDLNQPIMFICERGTRAYEAARFFMNHGYKNISYLGGGIQLYNRANKYFGSLERNYEY
jgi:NADPH-dependent 2,4-dienoyl-CoA reductase/sulfur reductase-like enzyme/rhodanese-related sulfurtransferase